ncbi:PH domain-containing protein [Brachyspira alvinipulli]|uniref:PH domain-containing protein n=1 Tax=Brachyspira alvinipulli TaxID=84379 RepID=UPI0004BCDAE9|nr:PH domain-containing protein [Brachyspira alvinipulli]
MSNPNEDRIKKQIEEIKPKTDTSFTKKELNELPNVIHEDEDILYFTSGFHKSNNNTMIIVLTTKRIIFLDKGMFISRRQFDIPLDMVNSVQSYTGLLLGELTIVHGAHSEIIKDIGKDSVVIFQQMATKEIEKYKQKVKEKENEHLASMIKGAGTTINENTKSKYILINNIYVNCSSIVEIKKDESNIIISTIKNDHYIKCNYNDIDNRYNSIISFVADNIFEC